MVPRKALSDSTKYAAENLVRPGLYVVVLLHAFQKSDEPRVWYPALLNSAAFFTRQFIRRDRCVPLGAARKCLARRARATFRKRWVLRGDCGLRALSRVASETSYGRGKLNGKDAPLTSRGTRTTDCVRRCWSWCASYRTRRRTSPAPAARSCPSRRGTGQA
ncbi:hypothetical protein BN2476_460006 [Paraburkholderia piptadeniae]|uniref:Uncharacterized protein n=1 Tax=Paraburkholderia piptadeniae TaxID=1701573 RepID=A0A1N7SDI8_9BURK|nr:hypothetical protein BN2476_460006 [Paraburkholderia piptadeniae]